MGIIALKVAPGPGPGGADILIHCGEKPNLRNARDFLIQIVLVGMRTAKQNRKNKRTRKSRVLTHRGGGAVGCKEPVTQFITGLMHGTHMKSFQKIIESGMIKSQEGTFLKTQDGVAYFTNRGAFFQAIFQCHAGKNLKPFDSNREVILVFSTKILDIDDNFHISNNWFGGLPLAPAGKYKPGPGAKAIWHSYNITQLNEFFTENFDLLCHGVERAASPFVRNEVVIHRDVPLENYLEEIWILDLKDRSIETPSEKIPGRGVEQMKSREPTKLLEEINTIISGTPYEHIPIRVISHVPRTLYRKGCEGTGAGGAGAGP
jgi:hypothetical protein